MITYFISDLHLQPEAVGNTKLFLDFLQHKAVHADAVYILGDLFALWLGDDLNQPYTQQIAAAILQLKQHNVPAYFMRGNRDFLIGQQFCQQAGLTLLNDPSIIDLYGRRVLVTHGDLLCSADVNYQRYRKIVQNSLVKSIFLFLPKALRLKIGAWVQKQASSKSKKTNQNNPALYDAVPTTVEQWFAKYKIQQLIHGHTHKPAVHKHTNATRYVLGDWTALSAKILQANQDSIELQELINSVAE